MTFRLTTCTGLVLMIALTMIPAATDGGKKDTIHGSWDVMSRQSNGMSYDIVMIVDPKRVTMTTRCSHEDNVVVATVSSAVEITGTQIRFLEADSAVKEHSPGYLRCKASIKPKTMSYELKDGQLVFRDPDSGKALTFPRSAH